MTPRFVVRVISSCVVVVCAGVSHLKAQEVAQTVNVFGDFRLRYENTRNQETPVDPSPDFTNARNREVVRLRAGVRATINELFEVGARLATGSSNDPNTTDVTLGSFVNDLEFSLDRVYVEMVREGLTLTAGKFANPFVVGNDFVWDGDVNPQGFAGSYTFAGSEQVTPTLTGLYGIIEEQTFGPDSYMWGGQLAVALDPGSDVSLTLAGAYYDYTIRSLSSADAGDIRSNRLTTDGTMYLSDFDMIDVTTVLTYNGLGDDRSLRFVGSAVKNRGAAGDDDSGFSGDLYLGRASQVSDTRFRYGYSVMERDAVFAAFSHDNTTLATNYKQHTFTFDWVAMERTSFNVTWYLFRKNQLDAPTDNNPMVSRVRLNASFTF